jgi:hypothetical protein
MNHKLSCLWASTEQQNVTDKFITTIKSLLFGTTKPDIVDIGAVTRVSLDYYLRT